MVGVVGDPHPNAPRGGLPQRTRHEVARLAGQAHVVESEVERLAGLVEKGHHAPGHVEGGLAPGVQGVDVDHEAATLPHVSRLLRHNHLEWR